MALDCCKIKTHQRVEIAVVLCMCRARAVLGSEGQAFTSVCCVRRRVSCVFVDDGDSSARKTIMAQRKIGDFFRATSTSGRERHSTTDNGKNTDNGQKTSGCSSNTSELECREKAASRQHSKAYSNSRGDERKEEKIRICV